MTATKEKDRMFRAPQEGEEKIFESLGRTNKGKSLKEWELTANGRFKGKYRTYLRMGVILSIAFHFLFIKYMPGWTIKPPRVGETAFEVIDVPPEVVIPPPPAQVAKPSVPVEAAEEPEEDVTIADTTPEASIVTDIAPDVGDVPSFTPYDTPPRAIKGTIDIPYPELLKKAGIEGDVFLWLKIDPEGHVMMVKVFKSSGNSVLDDVARQGMMKARFTPAYQRDTPVTVWVQWPVKFGLKD